MKKRILIVDDEEAVRRMIGRLVSALGLDAVEVASGEEALSAARSSSIDLVVTDMNLPGIDGLSMARTLLQEDPKRPVVLMTARQDPECVGKARAMNITCFTKPFDLDRIASAILNALSVRRERKAVEKPGTASDAKTLSG